MLTGRRPPAGYASWQPRRSSRRHWQVPPPNRSCFPANRTSGASGSEGSVKELQWGNPRVWLQVFVPDANGATVEWSFEMGAPGMLTRTGWKSSTLKADDKVTVIMNPLKDGSHSGRLVRVTLPDGRVLGPGGRPPPPAKPAA